MPWQAKPGCAEYHRPVVERIVNFFPPAWLLPPQTGKIFNDLEHCECCLRGYLFVEGFDIICKGGKSKSNSSLRFLCFHYMG